MENEADKPPFFKAWSGVYLLVIATLVAEIVLFTLISQALQ
ncbi:MAG TPA: hypothetical protein VF947_07895 [Myxococcales bacterium]|jgi:hypothetical protein